MQDLSETLELIRLSIYISFVITGGTFLYFVILFLIRFIRRRKRKFNRLHNLERRFERVEDYIIDTSKGKFFQHKYDKDFYNL